MNQKRLIQRIQILHGRSTPNCRGSLYNCKHYTTKNIYILVNNWTSVKDDYAILQYSGWLNSIRNMLRVLTVKTIFILDFSSPNKEMIDQFLANVRGF